MRMQLVFVRHGYTDGNHNQVYSGWTDHLVRPEGLEELEKNREILDYPETDRYYSSSLTRCLQTFEVLFGDKHELNGVSDLFREVYFGEYEDMDFTNHRPRFFDEWFTNEQIAGGETFSQVTNRLLVGIQWVLNDLSLNKQTSATIVCHGAFIKMVLILLGNEPFSSFPDTVVENGKGYIFDVEYDNRTKIIETIEYKPIPKKVD